MILLLVSDPLTLAHHHSLPVLKAHRVCPLFQRPVLHWSAPLMLTANTTVEQT